MTDLPHPLAEPPFAEAKSGGPKGADPEGQGEPIPHMVSTAPFDPLSVERLSPEQERFYLLAMEDDVVALPPAWLGGVCGLLPSDPLSRSSSAWRPMRCIRATWFPSSARRSNSFLRRPGRLRRP
jgi:hypothetical protein